MQTATQILDDKFLEVRAKLLEVAATLDRIDRSADESAALDRQTSEEILALDEALAGLEELDPRLCRVVECRYFGGLTVPETAEALGTSPATVKRDWTTARAWLRTRLEDDAS